MKPRARVLGLASTHFNDYVGTVAADDAPAVMDQASLYSLPILTGTATPSWRST
jgi:hypothetical protein